MIRMASASTDSRPRSSQVSSTTSSPSPEVALAPVNPSPATRKRVLIVDDNVDSGEMLVELAKRWGHSAVHAADGPKALAMAAELHPDVVLLDIGLPGMDGYEVAARLRQTPVTREARIIAVSGYGQEDDRKKSRAAGCDAHLVKPVNVTALEKAIGA
jgi:CheY-like chemotaxis protein